MDVDELVRAPTSQLDANRAVPAKQKLDSAVDDTEPEVKKIK